MNKSVSANTQVSHIHKLGALALAVFTMLQQPAMAGAQSPPAPAAAPQGQSAAPQAQPQVPQPEALTVLIKMSLAALNQANRTDNYSVLWGLGSDAFRKMNSPQTLEKSFARVRNAGMDLSPVILLSPQLTQLPVIEQGRYLRLRGYFPTQPSRIDFDLVFEGSQGQWKVAGLSVSSQTLGGSSTR